LQSLTYIIRLWNNDLPVMGDIDSDELKDFISNFWNDDFFNFPALLTMTMRIAMIIFPVEALQRFCHSARKRHQTFH
jgi:hypothetical protein